jgi:hypothetical protein
MNPIDIIFEKINFIMSTHDAWESAYLSKPYDGYDSCSLGAVMSIPRSMASPNYCQFHNSQDELGIAVREWSKVLPSLSYKQQVYEVTRLVKKLNEKGAGREFYAVEYALTKVDPTVYKTFIKALIGAIISGSVSDCVITDCSSVHNKEGLYKKTHRANIESFKYSPLTSIIMAIRMIRFQNKFSDDIRNEKRVEEIKILESCTDFSKLYDAPIFAVDGTKFEYIGHPDDYFRTPILLDEKTFAWINNPKEIFDISNALLAGWVIHEGDYDRINHLLTSIEARF